MELEMIYGIDQMEYRDDIIPRNICFAQGDCNSVGSLTTNSLTYSEDEGGVVTTSPKRWNCDVGLNPNSGQRYRKACKLPVFVPANHGCFRDPEFFPPFASMMQSQQSFLERYDNDEAENDDSLKRKFSCNLFGSNRISTHARKEMLRHQMSKPFRALPFPTSPRIDASCIGKNILQSVANQVQNAGSLNCTRSRKLVQQDKKESVGQAVEQARFVPAGEEWYPSDGETHRDKPRQSLNDSSLENKNGHVNSMLHSTSQSFDFSIDKAELSLSNDTHWLSLVATDESSVEESAVVLKLELD